MRDILEEAAIIYRSELDSFLTFVTPAAGLGLILLIVADTSLMAALVVIPALILLYLSAYAACVQRSGLALGGGSDGPGMWGELLARAPHILIASAPLTVLCSFVASLAVMLSNEGFWYIGVAIGLAAIVVAARWAKDHPYDQPLIVIYEATASEAMQTGPRLAAETGEWTLKLQTAIFLPLLAAALLSIAFAWVTVPLVGAALFLLAVALWLPFGALCFTEACLRLVDRAGPIEERIAEAVH
jgi:hypothetical protein